MKIQLHGVSKSFDAKMVLDAVDLTLSDGFYGLLGESGGGKTTLLRILCGLTAPDAGTVSFSEPPTFSYAFQEPRLFPHLTVRENLALISPERSPDELLRTLDLADAADLYPDELSGGMKTRAGVARCLSKRASVYLLDEPTGGQDAQHAKLVMQSIQTYAAGAVCLTVSHDISFLERFCDPLLTLANGKLFPISR